MRAQRVVAEDDICILHEGGPSPWQAPRRSSPTWRPGLRLDSESRLALRPPRPGGLPVSCHGAATAAALALPAGSHSEEPGVRLPAA